MRNLYRSPLVLVALLVAASWTVACSSGSDAPTDLSTDVPADVQGDTPADDATDVPVDPDAVATDVPTETATDVPADVAADAWYDSPGDVTLLADKVQVRFIHLAPQTGGVDLFINDSEPPAASDLQFTGTTGYLVLEPVPVNFDVAPAGSGLAGSILDSGKLPLPAGMHFTAYPYGVDGGIQFMGFPDDYSNMPTGKVRIRLSHVANGLGQVDFYLLHDGDAPLPAAMNANIGFASETTLDQPAGPIRLGVDVDNDGVPDMTFTTLGLEAGNVANLYLARKDDAIFLVVQPNQGSFRVDADPRPPAKARFRAVNLAIDALTVQVVANDDGAALVPFLGFGDGCAWQDLEPGPYVFDFQTSAVPPTSLLKTASQDLQDGKSYTLVGYDASATLKAGLLVDDDDYLADNMVRVRVFHAAPGLGPVDLWGDPSLGGGGVQLDQGMVLGTAGVSHDLFAGAITLGLDLDGDVVSDLLFTLPTLASGALVNVFVVRQSGTTFLLVQQMDGTMTRVDANPDVHTARVRVMNMTLVPSLDVHADNTEPELITDVPSLGGSNYVTMPSGAHNFDFVTTGLGLAGSLVHADSMDLAVGAAYTVLAYDTAAEMKAKVLLDESPNVPGDSIRIHIVQTARDFSRVDIFDVMDNGNVYSRATLGFGEDQSWDVPAVAFRMGFDTTDFTGMPTTLFQFPALPAGWVLNLYVVWNLDGSLSLVAQYPDNSTQSLVPMAAGTW
jgi:hypothetical protein